MPAARHKGCRLAEHLEPECNSRGQLQPTIHQIWPCHRPPRQQDAHDTRVWCCLLCRTGAHWKRNSAPCSHRFCPAATSMTGTRILPRGCLTRGSWTCTHPMRGTAWMAASLRAMLLLRTAAVLHPLGPAAGLDIRQQYTMTPCTSMAGTTAASAGTGARYGWSSTVNPLQPDILALSATRQLHTALSVHLESLATDHLSSNSRDTGSCFIAIAHAVWFS